MLSPSLSNARLPLMVLWALSGLSTLTFELVWTRELTLWAGNTVTASTLVIAVFFASAAMGNLWGARLVGGKSRPLLYYGRFETLAAVAALLTFALCRWAWAHAELLPSRWSLRVLGALLLVGPPSFCSGVAFPSLAETFVAEARDRTASGAPFYGLNLLGAALGVAAGGVLLPHSLGVQRAFFVTASVQFAGGIIAWRLAAQAPRVEGNATASVLHGEVSPWFGWLVIASSGMLSLATQSLLFLWVRQVLEGSVYAICGVLGAFVGGLGFGALGVGALRRRGWSPVALLRGIAGASALLLFLFPFVGAALSVHPPSLNAQTPSGLIFQSLAWCSCLLLPLTLSLGGIFPLAWELCGISAGSEGRVLGRALAVNKLGAAIGIAAGLFLLMPVAGLARSTFVIAWGYALIAFMTGKPSIRWVVVLGSVGLWQTLRPQPPLGITSDLRAIATTAGSYGPVTVVEDEQTGSRQILLNSRQRLSGTRHALASQRLQSWVPLLLCTGPKRVLTIGMAAGISAAAALDFPIEELVAVELVPEVVDAAREHFAEWNGALFADPRSRVVVDDGRLTLAQSAASCDAIICDLLFPSEEGTAHLYSRDFFQLARSRLTPAGVFCVWLPCYQHTAETADLVVRTFLDVFPNAIMVRASLDPLQPVVGLIGARQKLPVSRSHFEARLAATNLSGRSPFFRSAAHAQMLLVGDLHAADPGFDREPITTDDRPLFAFLGPRQPPPKERLFGVPFLNWSGRRFPAARFPSCDLGGDSPDDVILAIRAANHYLATAVANTVLPGDPRPGAVRARQVRQALTRAQSLSPATSLELEDLGY